MRRIVLLLTAVALMALTLAFSATAASAQVCQEVDQEGESADLDQMGFSLQVSLEDPGGQGDQRGNCDEGGPPEDVIVDGIAFGALTTPLGLLAAASFLGAAVLVGTRLKIEDLDG